MKPLYRTITRGDCSNHLKSDFLSTKEEKNENKEEMDDDMRGI